VPGAGNPQALNRYSYALNNPLRYKDPSGHVVETVVDIATIAYDVAEVVKDPSAGNVLALVLDVGAAFLPGVPALAGTFLRGSKTAAKAVSHADEAADAVKISAKLLDEGVERVGKETAKKATQTHHLLTNKSSRWTKPMEEIAGKYGLDLDGAWNKVAMPHSGRHANAYHEWVLGQLEYINTQAKGNKDEFLRLFDELIKKPVLENPDMVGRDFWR